MADYYSILKKTISGLSDNSQSTRTVVYSKARSAIDRQLRAIEPTPGEEAISRQMQMLETAIEKLEAEFGSTPAPQTAESSPAIAQPTAAGVTAPAPSVARANEVGEGNVASVVEPPQAPAPVPIAPAPADPQGMEYSETLLAAEPDTQIGSRNLSGNDAGSGKAKSGIGSTLLMIVLAIGVIGGGLYALWLNKDALMSMIDGGGTPAVVDTANDPNSDETNSVVITTNETPEADNNVRTVGDDEAPKNTTKLTPDGETLVVEPVEEPVADAQQTNTNVTNDAETIATPGETTPQVTEVGDNGPATNITSTGELLSVPSDPKARYFVTEIVRRDDKLMEIATRREGPSGTSYAIRLVQCQPLKFGYIADADSPDGIVRNEAPEMSDLVSGSISDIVSRWACSQTDSSNPATQSSNITPSVAQKAFLYEEGNSGADASRDNAAIIWSLGEEAGEGDEKETVIKGQLDVPGRDLSMSLLIRRNRDDSLPASHIIELVFSTPGEFSGGNISSVTRFVMKSSEQARGEGLVAVPAKISDGNFLIALNNLEQALATNRKLLLESSWIDVLIGYSTGRRALVTLEKGALGDKVFRDAFAAWEVH